MSKKETEGMIKDVWRAKEARDANSKRHTMSLAEFMNEYLTDRYGEKRTKIGYNLLYCCHKYKYDPDCEVFLQVRPDFTGGRAGLRVGAMWWQGCGRGLR